jgi:alpha-mannosidase
MARLRTAWMGCGLVVLATAVVRAESPKAVWQIGTVDHNYQEFALAGDHQAYLKTFPRDVAFTVGKSDPKTDWSWIQPGPRDDWAGSREHPFAIVFELADEPAGGCVLRIDVLDAQSTVTPRLRVDINGTAGVFKIKRGAGDRALIDPSKAKPQTLSIPVHPSLLRRGENRITLTTVDGSWILYDAVALQEKGAGAASVEIEATPTILFVHRDNRLMQLVHVRLSGLAPKGQVPLTVQIADEKYDVPVAAPTLGPVELDVPVPPADAPANVTLSVPAGGEKAAMTFELKPQKRWHIFCAPSTHTDIGYTDTQSHVIGVHNRNTDLAIRLCEQFPSYKWNLESSWAAQMFRRDRFDEQWEKLMDFARKQRIGIEAGYLNMLTGLCSEEELIRNMYYSARLHREAGVPFDSLTLTDAPSHVWTIPTILASAGIHYLSVGINQTRAPILRQNLHHKSPFWWEGPDGQKVLTNFSDGYAQAGRIALGAPIDEMRQAVESYLMWWNNRPDYPFDAILLHGAYSDNVKIGQAIAESQAAWNEKYEYPKIHLCRLADYFHYVQKGFADKIPTIRGCGGSWWEDGAGSTAKQTAINRVTHNRVVAAEMLWAAAAMGGLTGDSLGGSAGEFPQAAFDRIWDNILLYDEHTWGAHNSISQPWKDFVQEQWAVKAAYATTAAEDADRLVANGLRAIARRIGAPAGAVVVFNPLNRKRTDVVRVQIPVGQSIYDETGPLPTQKVHEIGAVDEVAFLAKDVPAIGYRCYRTGPEVHGTAVAGGKLTGNVFENAFYRITFGENTGAIKSIIDKQTGKELVDASSPFELNQVIYASSGMQTRVYNWDSPWPPAKLDLEKITNARVGPNGANDVYASVRAVGRGKMIEEINNEVILYDHVKRIDFINRINKKSTFDPGDRKPTYDKKEALYIAYPFAAGAKPEFRYEIGGASVRPNVDHLPGGCRDWLSVQNWVSVAGDGIGVAWCPIDTPLVTLCDLWHGEWSEEWPIKNGTILAWAMNNYWMTNYKACQDGWFEFRYSMTSDSRMPEAEAARFGWDAASPLLAVRLDVGGSDAPAVPSASFCQASDPGVLVSTVKRADDGKGVIVRLLEVAGQPEREVGVSCSWPGIFAPTMATACNVVEMNQGPLPIAEGVVRVKIGKHGIATIRFE